MNEFAKQLAGMSPKRLALLAMELQAKLDTLERAPNEPIAIIGMSCRFPGGARNPEAYWDLLRAGGDGINEVPADRWNIDEYYDPDPDAPGKMYSRYGGFVDEVDRFDPQFFGISPREALSMDPQQRLLLEVCWEALEHAARPPDTERGSRTGAFVGITANDYSELVARRGLASLDAYCMTGNALNFAAGRLSYVLGLQGPSLAVDTACSSSLVAVHLACQSLRSGDSRMALAAGVNLILSPGPNVVLSRARMLAADGRCKTFDAAADGYVRGEGCGVVVLKRLSEAVADGDRILAVIRGSAVNQDGPSGGLTVPNGPAQQAVLRDAITRAGVEPHEVDYVEAHGTGTSLGDPIEIEALGAVLGEGRGTDRPLLVGSAKTNIGHLESAAGIAGLIKVVLALQHRQVPPHLHLNRLNPHIRLEAIPAAIPTGLVPWPSHGGQRIAGISAFGASGTNAHVIVAEAPERAPRAAGAAPERPRHILTLSAKSDEALVALANRYAEHLAGRETEPAADVCFTANVGRVHFGCRAALTATSTAGLREALAAFASGSGNQQTAIRRRRSSGSIAPPVAFVFTGQGAQRAGMGRELYDTQPVFRAALDRCAEVLRGEIDRPLLELLYPAGPTPSPIDETAYTQPALFAFEFALSELWRSWGVRPSFVLGHSIGEYVAATVAGVFSLEDGLKLIAARGRLMQALPAGGAMAAVTANEARVREIVAPFAEVVDVAAVNAPGQIVLSGAVHALREIVTTLQADGATATWLPVSHAFHSPLVEPMLDDFERVAGQVTYRRPELGLVSNVTGELADEREVVTPSYWRRHARAAVRYARGVETLYGLGCRVFVEVGPRPTLVGLGQQSVTDPDVLWTASFRPGRGEWEQVLDTLGALYVHDVPVDWAAFDRPYSPRKIALPTYPFQRGRFWVEAAPTPKALAGDTVAERRTPRYEIVWRDMPLDPAARAGDPGDLWIIAGGPDGPAAALGARLRANGRQVLVLEPEASTEEWRNHLLAHSARTLQVVYLSPIDVAQATQQIVESQARACGGLLNCVRAIGESNGMRARLWVVTRGSQRVVDDDAVDPSQAPLWGLTATIAREYPELRPVRIDLGPDAERDLESLCEELTRGGGENGVGLRGGRRLAARVVPATAPSEHAPVAIRPDASYLVTGGLGALGLHIARWLAARGARQLVLVGRRSPGAAARDAIAACEAAGARVLVVQADVSRESDVERLFLEIERNLAPIRGVIHAAGVLDDGLLRQQTWDRFARVLAPKVAGAWHLHQHTRDRELDFFVLFSSVAALLGSAGQGSYAAANAYLDALAHHRRRSGLPGISINWGPWADAGMAGQIASAHQQRWSQQGIRLLPVDVALRAFADVIGAPGAQSIVADVDWDVLCRASGSASFVESGAGSADPGSPANPSAERLTRARMLEAEADERPGLVKKFCRQAIAGALGLNELAIGDDSPIAELGLDSLMALEVRNKVQRTLGVSIPVTALLEGSSITDVARLVLQRVNAETPAAANDAEGASMLTPEDMRALLGRIDDLSETEVDALLRQLQPES